MLLSDIVAGLRWNASLGVKFLRVVPYSTLVIVLLTLASQLAMLVASFLPLKVIIMLGSEDTPNYFPAFLAGLERDVLIGILSAGTVGFFLSHLVAERLIEYTTQRATGALLAKSQKIVLFENQEALAASSYQRYSRASAGAVFVCLALLGLGWVYPEMSLIMVGYFLLTLFLFWQGARYSAALRQRLENGLAQLLNVAALTGFFAAFGYLVIDFVFFEPPGVIVALISFLLIRQAMQRAAGAVADFTLLYRQMPRLNALFFHGQVFQPVQVDSKKSFWPWLQTDARQAWVAEVLKVTTGKEVGELECRWHQLGNPSMVGLRVHTGEEQFLLKLYEPNRSSLALHEADLMGEMLPYLPSPSWLGTVPVGKFHCVVVALPAGRNPEPGELAASILQLRRALLTATPGSEVTQRYIRSRAMLWQRLDIEVLERLQHAVINADQQHSLDVALAQLPVLQRMLAAMPLAIFNPELSQDLIWHPDTENEAEAILLNWGVWTLEPVGAGWPEAEKSLHTLGEALAAGAAKRPELENVKVEQAELAALFFALERECNRQRYNQALELLPRILERASALENNESFNMAGNIDAE